MGKFKLNDNVVFIDEDSLYRALGVICKNKKQVETYFVSGGKVTREARPSLCIVEFKNPNNSYSKFEIYEKRLCLNPNKSKINESKKSNHFFTNMFLMEKEPREDLPKKKKIKLVDEINKSENLCGEIALEDNF